MPTRRAVLTGGLAAAASLALPRSGWAASRVLRAETALVGLAGAEGPATAAWCYDGTVPGPALRFREGEDLAVTLDNRLPDPTTVHWHGLRPPVEMDGVPFVSQPPTAPGETFDYRFRLTESGTYWYHPHIDGSRQVGQGLHGALIVEEETPPDVDREILWVLDDWRMDRDAQLAPFGAMHDMSHAGRIGNVVTVNGRLDTEEPVRAGERIRLRLINAANARLFAPVFEGMERVWTVALDGHPCPPTVPEGGRVWLAPGQRADLIIDMTGAPGQEIEIVDRAYVRQPFHLMSFVHGPEAPLRDATANPAPDPLPPHRLPEPDLDAAARDEVVFEGGAMGGLRGAHMGGEFRSMRDLVEAGRLWAINGTVPEDMYAAEPLLTASQGESRVLQMANLTAFPHPIHLHGHAFRVLTRNGAPVPNRPWRDTVLLWPDETVEIGFVADNPGKWMFHCHILEHQEAGMMAVVAVA